MYISLLFLLCQDHIGVVLKTHASTLGQVSKEDIGYVLKVVSSPTVKDTGEEGQPVRWFPLCSLLRPSLSLRLHRHSCFCSLLPSLFET